MNGFASYGFAKFCTTRVVLFGNAHVDNTHPREASWYIVVLFPIVPLLRHAVVFQRLVVFCSESLPVSPEWWRNVD